MNTALVDTNIVSFLFKSDSRADAYAPFLQDNRLAISFTTVAELFEWAVTRQWGISRCTRLEQTLTTYVITPIDIKVCRKWGTIRGEQQAKGEMIAPQDAWIAATALRHPLPLVTHNPKHFHSIEGLHVLSVISS